MRAFSIAVVCSLSVGCIETNERYQRSGTPAIKLEIRRASDHPIEGWQPIPSGEKGTETLYVAPTLVLSNADLASTGVSKRESGPPSIAVKLTEAAGLRFAQFTTEMMSARTVGDAGIPAEKLAVLLDGKLVSAPVLTAPITSGTFELQGVSPTEAEARRIAKGMVRD